MSKHRNPYPARTNQKLYFARLQLDLMEQALTDDGFESESQAWSAREAAIWHLHTALDALCQELSRFYKLTVLAHSPKALADAMTQRHQCSPEAEHMLSLLQQPEGWMAHLQRLYDQCFEPVELPEMQFDEDSPARIAIPLVMQIDDAPLSPLDRDGLRRIHQELTELVRFFRAELVEF